MYELYTLHYSRYGVAGTTTCDDLAWLKQSAVDMADRGYAHPIMITDGDGIEVAFDPFGLNP